MIRFVKYSEIINEFKIQPFQILDAIKNKDITLYNFKGEKITWDDLQYYSEEYLRDYQFKVERWVSNAYALCGHNPMITNIIQEKYDDAKINFKNIYDVSIALINKYCLFDYSEINIICGDNLQPENSYINKNISNNSQSDIMRSIANSLIDFLTGLQNRKENNKKSPGRPKAEDHIVETKKACEEVDLLYADELRLPHTTSEKAKKWVSLQMGNKNPHTKTFDKWYSQYSKGQGRPPKQKT